MIIWKSLDTEYGKQIVECNHWSSTSIVGMLLIKHVCPAKFMTSCLISLRMLRVEVCGLQKQD